MLRRPTRADIDAIYRIHTDPRACAHNPADALTNLAEAEDRYRSWDEHWHRPTTSRGSRSFAWCWRRSSSENIVNAPAASVAKASNSYGDRDTDRGNLAHQSQSGLVAGFTQIMRGCRVLLRGGGVVVTARPYRKRGGLVDRGDTEDAQWTTRRNALRWGRWTVFVAMAVPMVYAVSRVAMALGSPIGIPLSIYDEMEGTGVVFGELFMATLATFAAVLTVGLVRRWGEVFPRWLRVRAGERVPPEMAIIAGAVMAVVITSAGVSKLRSLLINGIDTEASGITGPGML